MICTGPRAAALCSWPRWPGPRPGLQPASLFFWNRAPTSSRCHRLTSGRREGARGHGNYRTGLGRWDLPALFEAADTASLAGQRQYVRTVRLRLLLTIIAAATGVVTWQLGANGVDVAAVGTAIALAATSLTELSLKTTRPEDRWHDGRALAESAKSLAWRYSVGGVPFTKQGDEKATERGLVEQIFALIGGSADDEHQTFAASRHNGRQRHA